MAANVLNSPKAVEVSVYVVRAFIQQRAMLMAHADLSLQLERLERKLISSVNLLREHDDTLLAHESQIEAMIEAINEKGEDLSGVVRKNFDFKPLAIIERLKLREPIFRQTATYGHFGKKNLPWEKLVKINK